STYYFPEKRQKLDQYGAVEYKFFVVPASSRDLPSKPISPEELQALRLSFDFNSIEKHDSACVRRSVTLRRSDYARCFCATKHGINPELVPKPDGTGFMPVCKFSTTSTR